MSLVRGGLAALFMLAATAVRADVTAGDSIGVGVGVAAGVPTVAAVSASLYGNGEGVVQQFARLSRGTRVYLFLGTNNVASGVAPFKVVRTILDRARHDALDLVWVGPPCMTTNRYAHFVPQFDASLGAIVRASGFRYVSLYGAERCRLQRSSDGVHFNYKGYQAVWHMVRNAPDRPY
jgi:hypothetical protein